MGSMWFPMGLPSQIVCVMCVYCPIFNVIWFFIHKSTTSHSTILSITSSSIALSFLVGGKDSIIMHYVHGHVAPNEWTPLTPVQVEHEFSLLKFRVLLRVGNPEGICPHSSTSFVALDSFDKMSKTPGEKRRLKSTPGPIQGGKYPSVRWNHRLSHPLSRNWMYKSELHQVNLDCSNTDVQTLAGCWDWPETWCWNLSTAVSMRLKTSSCKYGFNETNVSFSKWFFCAP